MTPSLELIIGLLTGAAITYFMARFRFSSALSKNLAEIQSENSRLTEKLKSKEELIDRFENENENSTRELKAFKEQELSLRETVTKLETKLSENQKSFEQKFQLLEETKKQLSDHFKGLSHQALESNNKMFIDLAKSELEKGHLKAQSDLEKRQSAIDEILKPLAETLKKVDQRHDAIGKHLSETSTSFKEQISHLTRAQQQLQSETGNLVKALRTPQVRGRWGEMTLLRVAELAGMEKHCDFEEQVSQSHEDGVLRPDMVVRLPNSRQIVVDAKTPLQAYLEALEAETEEERQQALTAHTRQLKNHMNQLAEKAYWSQFTPSPEFVVLFVPGENFFSAALTQDPGLIEEGIRKGVILATPTTLISLLKAVGYGWRQEKLAENAAQVSRLGRELYDRLSILTQHFGKLEKHLKSSVAAYNSTVGALENRVLSSARRFRDLGIEAKSDIPETHSIDAHPRRLQANELLKSIPQKENTKEKPTLESYS